MKVLALVPSRRGHSPGQRSNIEVWQPRLRAAGIDIAFEPFETPELQKVLYSGGHHTKKLVEVLRGCRNRFDLITHLDEFDAVYVFREAALLGPAFLERMIARKKPLIFHFDDPVFVPYKSPSNGYLSYLKFFGKIKEIIRLSSLVIVNSRLLMEYALQFNDRVTRIPNSFDENVYFYEPFPPRPEPVTIGWSGSPTTLPNLTLVANALKTLAEKVDYKFRVIGGKQVDLPGVNVEARDWNAATEIEDLRRMQVGLIPLPAVEWNKYKFIMKAPQYMALGIVPVGTPMASNPEVIRHGENGFLAETDEEWVEFLSLLVNDHALRNKMSKQAAADAKTYTLEANIGKVIEAFHAAVK